VFSRFKGLPFKIQSTCTATLRQRLAPAAAAATGSRASGVSSFAFQGTNAHATVSNASSACSSDSDGSKAAVQLIFDRSRFWPVPQVFTPFNLRACGASSSAADSTPEMRFVVTSPLGEMADMLDHAVGGRAILPGAAMMELAHAGAKASLSSKHGWAVQAAFSLPIA
jgi:hypothetical protein